MASLRKYVIVREGPHRANSYSSSVETIVPRLWISENQSFFYWPLRSHGNANDMIINDVEPDPETWDRVPILKVLFSHGKHLDKMERHYFLCI